MRKFIKVVSGVVLVASCVAIVLGIVTLFVDKTENDFMISWSVLGSGVACILFAGITWVLVEIADKLAPREPSE